MKHKLTSPQLKKYDITQKVIEALADTESRAIIFTTIKKGKTAYDLAKALKIPLISVYKKLADLQNLTLIEIEKFVTTDSGRRLKIYRSRIKKANIIIRNKEPEIQLSAN